MTNVIGGSIVWNLDVDSKKYEAGLDAARAKAKNLQNDLEGGSRSLSGLEKNLNSASTASLAFAGALTAVGAGLGVAIGFGVKYAANLETMRAGFITLLGSATAADEAIAQIQKDAAKTPFNFAGLVNANQLLTSVTKNSKTAERLLLDVGKALVAMGKGQPELDRIIVNLQQIGAVGHASAIDIKQFAFAGIPIYDMLNESIKGTGKALDDMISSGEVTFDMLTKLFIQAGEGSGRFSRAFIEQGGTMNQIWSNFIDNLGISASAIVKQTGIFDALKVALNNATNALAYFASPEGMGKVISFFNFLKSNLPIVIGLIVGGLVPAIRTALIPSLVKLAASLYALSPWLLLGAAIGAVVEILIEAFGGWEVVIKSISKAFVDFTKGMGVAVDFLKGKFMPLIQLFQTVGTRIGQILRNNLGISGEFGGLKNAFASVAKSVDFYSQRIGQIVGDMYQKIKNFLAFGGTAGDATIVQALEGIWNRLKPIKQGLEPLFDKIMANLKLTGLIIQTQVVPAWNALMETLKPLAKALEPIVSKAIVDTLTAIAVALGAVIAIVLAIVTGLASGIANALPYIAQALEGLIQFVRGFVQIITGLLTGNLGLVWEGLKQSFAGAVEFIANGLMAILKFVSGFIQGVIAFFVSLYNALVGHSIIPDMVNAIVLWFTSLPGLVYNALASLVTQVTTAFQNAWDAVLGLFGGWINDIYSWGQKLAESFANGFGALGGYLMGKVNDAINALGRKIKGNSPPPEGPLHHIDDWGFNIGSAWVEGLKSAIAGFNLPQFAYQPSSMEYSGGAISSGDTNVSHAPVFNFNLGNFIGTENEKRKFAYDLQVALDQYYKGRGQK